MMINEKYIDDLIKRIDAIPDCKTLAKLMSEITIKFTLLQSMNTEIIDILNKLKTIPSNITDVIDWITTFINHNILGPYQKALLLEAELALDIARLMQAIEAKAAGMSCTIPLVNVSVMGSLPVGSMSLGG